MRTDTKEFLDALAGTALFCVLVFLLIVLVAMLEPVPGRSSAVRAPALGAGAVAGSNPAVPTIHEGRAP